MAQVPTAKLVPTVREIMDEVALSLSPDMDAYMAIDAMVAKKLSGVPVIDDQGSLVGFLTEKDCLRLQVTSHQYNSTGRKVRDCMSEIKQALHPDMDLLGASTQFLSCNFPILPVLESGKLVGSISRQHMLQAIQKVHRERGIVMERDKQAQKLVANPSSIEQFQTLVGRSNKKQLASVFGGRHARKKTH